MKQKSFSLNATHLRILALCLMLLDHLGTTVVPGNAWMNYVGRLAFPIFAFQAAEGYHHTHDLKGYCKRLAVFALVSEIPFNLMLSGSPFYPLHQNVMLTLLLGLLACRAYDRERWLACFGWLLAGSVALCDYRGAGVLTVLVFHVFRGRKLSQLIMLFVINFFCFQGPSLPVGFLHVPVQAFAVLAVIPIWLYNGKKGRGGKWLRYGSYVFYPLHALILGLL